MLPSANTRHYRLKAAVRDLVHACGGVERAAELATLGKSTVARWQDAELRDFPGIAVVALLEAECGRADVSRAMAELAGLTVGARDAAQQEKASLMATHAEAVTQAAQLMAEGALVFSDLHVTPAEATAMDRAAQRLERSLAQYRTALAGVRGAGGMTLVQGGAA